MARTAIIYDFDGTLARGNIQEVSFIPEIGMTRNDFWNQVRSEAQRNDADEILVYMNMMLEKAREKHIPITKHALRTHGKNAKLFDGLEDRSWFRNLAQFTEKRGLNLEHYIISSGIREMIDGCQIRDAFTRVFASSYMYRDDIAVGPAVAINYTSKTQFLFRINKGIETVWDNRRINAFMPEDERPIPFRRMIFIGDGDTDIPTMKMISQQGGSAIAVYDPDRNKSTLDKIHRLISDDRVDFVAPADYTSNAQLEIIVRGILGRIARAEGYRPTSSDYA